MLEILTHATIAVTAFVLSACFGMRIGYREWLRSAQSGVPVVHRNRVYVVREVTDGCPPPGEPCSDKRLQSVKPGRGSTNSGGPSDLAKASPSKSDGRTLAHVLRRDPGSLL